jgi:CRISPR-associated Csh1 family protein
MITTLYNFADLLKDDDNLKVYFSPAENPFEGREEKGRVLVGTIEKEDFKGFQLQNFNTDLIPKILYRRIAPRGTGIVPTLYVNISGPDKKGKTGIEKTREKLISSLENNSGLLSLESFDEIANDFQTFDYNRDYSYLVTFKIDGSWLGEIKEFKSIFFDESYKKYYDQQSKGKSVSDDQICSITGKSGKVYGFVNTLGFAIDSQAFIRNGFDTSNGYKMFPVSEDAIPILEGARAILENKVAARFYDNVKYAILPHFVFQPDRNDASYIAQKFLNTAAFNADAKEDTGSKGFINDTEFILNEIIKDGDLKRHDIYYSILFFEQQQAQFKIHLELNDVLPSRINKVLNAKDKAQERYKPLTSYTTKNGDRKSQHITLYRLKDYFSTGEKNTQPAFYKLVNSIFTGQPYDDSKLLKLVLNSWKTSFKKNFHDKEYYFNSLIKNSLGNLYFLHLLGIFKKNHPMNKETVQPDKLDAFHFIESHPVYFEKEYLKGAFIFGCLVARLLYNQPGNAFMKELHGLNIDRDLVTKKFPKLISKLRQYGSEFPDMEAAAMKYFAMQENKVTKDEISFAFTMGLVLQKDFDRINKSNKNQNSEDHE